MNKTSEGHASSVRICAEVAEVKFTPHTQGKLIHKRLGVIVGGPMVEFARGSAQKQICMVTGLDDGSDMEANARRLVACWNACEGISTEDIEGDLKSLLMGAVRRTNAAEAQRDELLAALEMYISAGFGNSTDHALQSDAFRSAHAAIERATP